MACCNCTEQKQKEASMNGHVGFLGALLALLLAAQLAGCSVTPTRGRHTASADDVVHARSDDAYGAFPYGPAPFVYGVRASESP